MHDRTVFGVCRLIRLIIQQRVARRYVVQIPEGTRFEADAIVMARHRSRLQHNREDVAVRKCAGAVGVRDCFDRIQSGREIWSAKRHLRLDCVHDRL